ncbi:MAG: HNH endonuclease signature motif containing protein, partial [Gammaproteobacteria bacterium]
ILNHRHTRRLATPAQARALAARDRGCSFPGCSRPPDWCQRHHVIAWQDGGRTDLDNLTLVCKQHHRTFEKHNWRCEMRDGLPYWIPPEWI